MQEFGKDAEGLIKQKQYRKQGSHKQWIAWVALGKWLLCTPAALSKVFYLQKIQ